MVAEALTLGVLASAVGIAAGLGVAKGINALFKAVGADIPTAGIALEPRTILIAVLVGVGVTLLSALAPALRATRVPPVAALQEGAALPPTRFTRFSTAIALAFAALGGGSLAYGIFADGGTSGRLLFMGLGALLLFVAIAMLAKFVVRPASRIIGWPMEKLAPTSGRLARDNAGRNPSRTAATAAALMIGLAMVVFVAVFAQAMKGSFGDAISKSTRADLVAQDQSAFLTVPQKTVRGLEDVPGVESAAGVAWAALKVKGGGVLTANAVDPAVWPEVWGHDWRRGGSDALFAKLDARQRHPRGRLADRRQGQGRRHDLRHQPERREGQAHRARLLPRPDGLHRHDDQPRHAQEAGRPDRRRHDAGAHRRQRRGPRPRSRRPSPSSRRRRSRPRPSTSTPSTSRSTRS